MQTVKYKSNQSKRLALLATILVIPMMTDARPVYVGEGVEHADNCGLGVVHGLNPNGDGFLAVRAAPSIKAKMLYKIHNGQKVWLCDLSKNGKWHGIIYTKKGIDCGLERKGNYKGRCYQGWVSAKFVRFLAG